MDLQALCLCVLAYIGCHGGCCGLQRNVEYHYEYKGQISSGIHEVRSQVSAIGIKASLTLQIKKKNQGIAKLSEVKVGFYNGDVDCETRNPLPVQYEDIESESSLNLLQAPFEFNFDRKEGVMTVSKEEPEWVTNIKKSVIGIFDLHPVTRKVESEEEEEQSFLLPYSLEEETLKGRCKNHYTMSKVPQTFNVDTDFPRRLSRDVSGKRFELGSNRSRPFHGIEDLWILTRTVDLSSCKYKAFFQKNTGGITGKEGRSQNENLQLSSLGGDYLLRGKRGKGGSLRLERATVEEFLLVNPFGLQKEKLQTRGNQSLFLIGLNKIKKPLVLPHKTKKINTWNFQMASPYTKPKRGSLPWVNYYGKKKKLPDNFLPLLPQIFLTGRKWTESSSLDLATEINDLLDVVAEITSSAPKIPNDEENAWSTSGELLSSHMITISQAVRGLDEAAARKLFPLVFKGNNQKAQIKQMFLVDASIASGESVPVKEAIDTLMSLPSSQMSDFRAAAFLMTLGHNLAAPSVTKVMLPYLKNLNISTQPLLTSTALINFATGFRRMCLQLESTKTSLGGLYGDTMCGSTFILKEIFPFYDEGLKASNETWQQGVYIQALANLGLKESIHAISPFISGTSTEDLNLRALAIQSFSADNFPKYLNQTVMNVLDEIVNNQEENLYLRQEAFIVLVRWNPGPVWWSNMARRTWYEASHQFGTLVALTIESLAASNSPSYKQQSATASLILPLVKPYSTNYHYSYAKLVAQYHAEEKIDAATGISWLTGIESVFPKQLHILLKNDFAGLKFDLLEVFASFEGTKKITKYFAEMFDPNTKFDFEEKKHSGLKFKMAEDILNAATEEFSLPRKEEREVEVNLLVKFMKNIQAIFSFPSFTAVNPNDYDFVKLLRHPVKSYTAQMNKFVMPFFNELYLPTAVGLPLIHTEITSVSSSGEGYFVLNSGNKLTKDFTLLKFFNEKFAQIQYQLDLRLNGKVISKTKVLAPWSNFSIASGISSVKSINVPIKGEIRKLRTKKGLSFTTLTAPIYGHTSFPWIYCSNVPYTSIEFSLPASTIDNSTNFLAVAVEDTRRPVVKWDRTLNFDFTGIDAKLVWEADTAFGLNENHILQSIRHPTQIWKLMFTPAVKFWKMALMVNPRQSETSAVSQEVALTNFFNESSYFCERCPDHRNKETLGFSVSDSHEERRQKLVANLGKFFKSVRYSLQFIGNNLPNTSRTFDLSATWKKTDHYKEIYTKYTSRLSFMLKNIPNNFEDQYTSCVEVAIQVPAISDLDLFEDWISKIQLTAKVDAEFRGGAVCHQQQSFANFSLNMELSEERRQRLVQELKSSCISDSEEPLLDLKTIPTYDRLQGSLESSKKTPDSARTLGLYVWYLLQGFTFPHYHTFNTNASHPSHIIKFEGKRTLNKDSWSLHVTKSLEALRFEDLPIPILFTQIAPYKGFTQREVKGEGSPAPDGHVLSHRNCFVTHNLIQTFNGNKGANPGIGECWSLLAADLTSSERWMLFIRRFPETESFEMLFVNSNLNLIVTVSQNSTMVNGRPFLRTRYQHYNHDKKSLRFALVVRKRVKELEIPNLLNIKFSTSVIIRLEKEHFTHNVFGLCQTLDALSSQALRLRGPNGCLFNEMMSDFSRV